MKKNNLEFNNTKIAFNYKSNFDLKRAYFLFKLLSLGYISKLGRKLLKTLVWMNFPIDSLIKKTVYAQFCGGTWKDKIQTSKLFESLNNRKEISFDDYQNLHKSKNIPPLSNHSVRFSHTDKTVNSKGYRRYKI